MKQLPIDLSELEEAFDNSTWQINYYLDTETGQVLLVTDETRQELEAIYEEFFDPDAPDAFDIEAALAQSGLPAWQKDAVREADQVESGYGLHVVAVPKIPTYEAYNEMQEFIETIEDKRLCNQLQYATQGKGAFSRFRDILWHHTGEQERWFAFRNASLKERILEWLADEGIEPKD